MATRKSKQKQRNDAEKKRHAREVPKKPSALALYIVRRQTVFSYASVILIFISLVVLALYWPEVQQRIANTPPAATWSFIGLWIISMAYRTYHNRTYNPRLRTIVLDDREVRSYAIGQTVSTLTSLMFVVAAALYLPGFLDPIGAGIARYLPSLDPQTIAFWTGAITTVFTSIIWNVLSSAIWDGIKWLLWGKRQRSGV